MGVEETPGEWALVRGEYTGIYKVWTREMWDMTVKTIPNDVNTLITYGDKETLDTLAQLHNEQHVRDQGGWE